MKFPPDNFEQLRQITMMLRQGDIDLAVGKKSLSALDLMIAEPDIVALNNIVEVAKKINFSSASLTRLAKLLGFQGFNAFQLIFKQKSKIASDFYSKKLQMLMNNNGKTAKGFFNKQLTSTIDEIQSSINHTDEESLVKASYLLAKKHRVFIFGYRQSSAIANILRYGLALLRPNVQMLVQADHGVAIAMGQLKRDDLLVVIGSAPYSNLTVKITTLAKQQQCQILALTDSTLSPLNKNATVALNISSSSDFYANSLVASCFFIENILSLTAVELGQRAVQNLQQHEQLLSKFDVSS